MVETPTFSWLVMGRKALVAGLYGAVAVVLPTIQGLPTEKFWWVPVAIAALEALRNYLKFRGAQ